MTRLRAFAVLSASILCIGCAGVTREQALATAKQEVARRHCTLPRNYTVDVEPGIFQAEFERPRPLWGVHFCVPTAHGPRELVTVLIDRRSGAVDTFSDGRRTVPSRI
jgi:hypothetical protein